jgi:hypothetical protein
MTLVEMNNMFSSITQDYEVFKIELNSFKISNNNNVEVM